MRRYFWQPQPPTNQPVNQPSQSERQSEAAASPLWMFGAGPTA
jgi:hypothetical protein